MCWRKLNILLLFHKAQPGKPGTPEIVDWDVDRVDLKWTPPKDIGGAPIQKYVIEKKEKFGSAWEPFYDSEVYFLLFIKNNQSSAIIELSCHEFIILKYRTLGYCYSMINSDINENFFHFNLILYNCDITAYNSFECL